MKTYLCLDSRCVREWPTLRPILKEIVCFLQEQWPKQYMIVTSIRRTETENVTAGARTKIHVVKGRAIDIRISNLGPSGQKLAINLAKRINRRWRYDSARPNLGCAYARAHGSGPHIHLQIHSRTIRTVLRLQELAA